jgi:hypothetical protein
VVARSSLLGVSGSRRLSRSDYNLIQCVDRFLLTRVATDEDLRRTRHVTFQFADMLAPKRFHPDEVLSEPTELG